MYNLALSNASGLGITGYLKWSKESVTSHLQPLISSNV